MTTAPTLSDLYSSISSDLKSRFNIQSENDLKRVLSALALSEAGVLKLIYLALMDVKKNLWPDLADPESMGGTLERFGRTKLNRDPYPATQGVYEILVTGTAGTTIKANTQFVNKSTGYYYTSTTDTVIGVFGSNVTVVSDKSGLDYLLSTTDILYTVNTIANVDAPASVVSITTNPTDAENIEDYRSLVLQSYRLEPNGGSPADYVSWALDVVGIRSVYPYTTAGSAGSAVIYVECLPTYSSDGNGSAAQSYLDALWKSSESTGVYELDPDTTQDLYQRGRRQLGFTNMSILSVTPQPVVVKITSLKTATTSIKASISSALSKMLYYKRPFVPGVGDVNDRKDTLYYKDVVSTLDTVLESGNTYDDVTITVNGKPLPNKFLNGDIPYLSEVQYE